MLQKIKVLLSIISDVNDLVSEILAGRDPKSPGGEDFTPEETAKILASVDKIVAKAKAQL